MRSASGVWNIDFELLRASVMISFFFFNDTATTEIYTLSLHDALPISEILLGSEELQGRRTPGKPRSIEGAVFFVASLVFRSEEHTSELQSRSDLVCRLLLEKKKPTP